MSNPRSVTIAIPDHGMAPKDNDTIATELVDDLVFIFTKFYNKDENDLLKPSATEWKNQAKNSVVNSLNDDNPKSVKEIKGIYLRHYGDIFTSQIEAEYQN